jgi:hypothetical protein
VQRCGGCAHVCGAANGTPTCEAGKCKFACSTDFAHCGTDDALGCDTNLKTNKEHCGKCGYSCLGGECVDGKCEPLKLHESNVGSPPDLAIDATHVYFVNRFNDPGAAAGPGKIFKIGKDGKCGASSACPQVIVPPDATITSSPRAIAVDNAGIYWANSIGNVYRANKDGSGVLMLGPAGAAKSAGSIFVGGTFVWWTNTDAAAAEKIYRAKPDATASNAFATTAAPGTYLPATITGDAANLYWTDFLAGKVHKMPYGAVQSCVVETNCTTLTVNSLTRPGALAQDATNLYIGENLNYGLSRVVKVPKLAGGAVTELAIGQDVPQAIVSDGTTVYFSIYTAGNVSDTIRKVPVAAATPCTGSGVGECEVVAAVPYPNSLRMDAESLYWVSQAGTVNKLRVK